MTFDGLSSLVYGYVSKCVCVCVRTIANLFVRNGRLALIFNMKHRNALASKSSVSGKLCASRHTPHATRLLTFHLDNVFASLCWLWRQDLVKITYLWVWLIVSQKMAQTFFLCFFLLCYKYAGIWYIPRSRTASKRTYKHSTLFDSLKWIYLTIKMANAHMSWQILSQIFHIVRKFVERKHAYWCCVHVYACSYLPIYNCIIFIALMCSRKKFSMNSFFYLDSLLVLH